MAWVLRSLPCYFNEYRVLYDLRVMKVSPKLTGRTGILSVLSADAPAYIYYQLDMLKEQIRRRAV